MYHFITAIIHAADEKPTLSPSSPTLSPTQFRTAMQAREACPAIPPQQGISVALGVASGISPSASPISPRQIEVGRPQSPASDVNPESPESIDPKLPPEIITWRAQMQAIYHQSGYIAFVEAIVNTVEWDPLHVHHDRDKMIRRTSLNILQKFECTLSRGPHEVSFLAAHISSILRAISSAINNGKIDPLEERITLIAESQECRRSYNMADIRWWVESALECSKLSLAKFQNKFNFVIELIKGLKDQTTFVPEAGGRLLTQLAEPCIDLSIPVKTVIQHIRHCINLYANDIAKSPDYVHKAKALVNFALSLTVDLQTFDSIMVRLQYLYATVPSIFAKEARDSNLPELAYLVKAVSLWYAHKELSFLEQRVQKLLAVNAIAGIHLNARQLQRNRGVYTPWDDLDLATLDEVKAVIPQAQALLKAKGWGDDMLLMQVTQCLDKK